ncbi:MAG: zinc ribbon domain-containing protein [Elusimicrobia bacterium]|nr:zinc ribbon domain-containing protein [Elusimicrobiota bacterium]
MTTRNDCQSCGMPLKKDPKGGGTYSDGSKSHTYCSLCYADGRFTHPDMTVDQMKILSAAKLHDMGYPLFVARLLVRNLHKLERWNAGASRPVAPGLGTK